MEVDRNDYKEKESPTGYINSITLLYKRKCYNDKASVCHHLNSHFINVRQDLAAQLPNYNINPSNFIYFRGICDHIVQDVLIGLKLNKSFIGTPPPPPPKCIELACNFISEPLRIPRLLNLLLSQGTMANLLKISKITLVDKGGEITDPMNFRPISTLSALTQIFEKKWFRNNLFVLFE